ncbi:hypothetical protein D9M68_07160 [compost metagenome]
MAVAAGDGEHLGGQVFGQAVLEAGAVGVDHLGNAGDLGCRRGGMSSAEWLGEHLAGLRAWPSNASKIMSISSRNAAKMSEGLSMLAGHRRDAPR